MIVYCTNQAELTELRDDLVSAAHRDALTWVAYPKARQLDTDLSRDVLAELVRNARRPTRPPDCPGRRLVGVAAAPGLTSMVSTDEARRLALSLPDAVEQDHHGRPSFRVAGRIFATLWDPRPVLADAWEGKKR